jgi:hypothetical protein
MFFQLLASLVGSAKTEFGENYPHRIAFLNRTGRKFCVSVPRRQSRHVNVWIILAEFNGAKQIDVLPREANLTTVRDNLRHTSVSTTSIYLHTDRAKRARQIREAFGSTNG